MSDPDAYLMLISGLPRPEALFLAKRPPLSRLKLDRRLRILSPEDAQVLGLVEGILSWGDLPFEMTDAQLVARTAGAMRQIENATVGAIIRDRLELRSCVAALRQRHRGERAPGAGEVWGYGRWVAHIARNWTEATFRLDGVFPWLREADRLLKAGDTIGLERLILERTWRNLNRLAAGHEFDFEAVVIYVLKWNIVNRAVRSSGDAAASRLEELAHAGLGEYANVFEEEQW